MADPERQETEPPQGMRCDFCGQIVPRVRRVALDVGYDRLQARHAERYACPTCSDKKERQRTGLER
jgi:ribosomal protein L37AE/L43A